MTQSSFELGIFYCKVHFCEIMSFEAINLKLETPTDIAEEELILSHRQRLIEDKLLNCYAIEVASIITALVVKNCDGCIIDHPSQRQHPCLTMESDERMWLYFDEALDVVCEATIAENFMNSLRDIKPSVNGLELLKYTCKDWRKVFCSRERRKLKTKTHELL